MNDAWSDESLVVRPEKSKSLLGPNGKEGAKRQAVLSWPEQTSTLPILRSW